MRMTFGCLLKMSLFVFAGNVQVCVSDNLPLYASDEQHSLRSLDEYKKLVFDSRDKISSMRVKFRSDVECDPVIEERGLLAGLTMHEEVVFAFSEDKRFCEVISSGVATDGKPIKVERITSFNGSDCRRREYKAFNIQGEKSAYSELNAYTSGLAWPITDAERAFCSKNPTNSHFIPYCIDDLTWEIDSDQQLVGNVSCIVLRQKDKSHLLYLDPQRNYTLIRREQLNPALDVQKWSNDFGDFSECLPGVFLPLSIHSVHERRDERSKQFIGNIKITLAVQELTVNDVSDDQFKLTPSPGEAVIDQVRRITYKYSPSDDNALDRAVDQSGSISAPGRKSWGNIIIALNVFAVTVFACYAIGTFFRQRRG